jgi:hypothetical protein
MNTYIATFDTETENGFLGEAICAQYVLFDDLGEEYIKPSYKIGYGCIKESLLDIENQIDVFEEGINELVTVRVYVHNLSYDLMRIASEKLPCKINMNGGEVIAAEVKLNNITFLFLDSFKLLPASLAKLSKSFLPPELRKKEKSDMGSFDVYSEEDIEYALYDVIALKHIILEFARLIECKPSELKRTAPSQAFHFLKKVYTEQARNTPRWKNPKGTFKATREDINKEIMDKFYFGGRIYIRDNHSVYEQNDTESLDITSSYPAQMRKYEFPLPGVNPVTFVRHPGIKGRYFIKIRVTDYFQQPPCIPYRQENGSVCYPHGNFTAFISDVEYEHIKKTYKEFKAEELKCLFWSSDKCAKWAAPYIDKYYEMKLQGDKLNALEKGSGEALRTIGKLFLNAPYGKAAQKYSTYEPIYINMNKPENEVEGTSPDHRNPAFSAFITAAGRVQLYEMIEYYGWENIVYCDTDSVKIKKSAYNELQKHPDENEELGGWKNEGGYTALVISAPKVYAGVHEGKVEVKAKGLMIKGIVSLNGKTIKRAETVEEAIKQSEKVTEEIYALIKNNTVISASYSHRPKKMKGFIRDQATFAAASIRSITRPENVTGYSFDGIRYHVKILKENS